MTTEDNVFIPRPPVGRETYGSYCHRLEEALITITAFKKPPELAIKALAFIAMEAPSDFDHCSIREVLPSRRIRDFLGGLPAESREMFRVEALKLPQAREDRINMLLRVS